MGYKTLLIDDKKVSGTTMPKADKTARSLKAGVETLAEEKWELLLLDFDLGEFGETGLNVLEFLKNNPQHRPQHIWLVSNFDEGTIKMSQYINEHMPEIRVITRDRRY